MLKAVVYYYRFLLVESTPEIEKEFTRLTQEGIDQAQRALAREHDDLEALFFTGMAYIYRAAFHGEAGNWMKAFWYGRTGLDYLKRVVAIDSTYYDAYFGLGVYHYYADAMPKLVKTVSRLIGIEGNRLQGLQELQKAAEHGFFAKVEAAYFLGKIYTQMERDFEKAQHWLASLAERYPNNAGFLLDLGVTQRRLGQPQEAINTFETALRVNRAGRFPVFEKLGRFQLGKAHQQVNDCEKAVAAYEAALTVEVPASRMNNWLNARAALGAGDCSASLGRHETAALFYRQVGKTHDGEIYKIAQERLKNFRRDANKEAPNEQSPPKADK